LKIEDKVKVNSKHITTLLEHVTDIYDELREIKAELEKDK